MSFKAMIGGEPSLMKPVKEPNSNLPLPNDLVLSCLARVSRSFYPTLSLVSKSFRSLLTSPELYKTRSLLNRTERCLYVCLQFPPDPKPRWFTLCLKPNKTLTSKESSCHVLVPISNINSPQVDQFSLVGSGHNLYAICEAAPCSNVSCLDYRTNTWFKAPTMRLAHTGTQFDGSLYLAQSCENPESLNCVEVFDTKIQSWKPVQPEKRKFNLRNMEGAIYMSMFEGLSTNGLALNAKESKWEVLGLGRDLDLLSVCQIDNIIYLYNSNGEFIWTDRKVGERVQRKLEGLEGLPKLGDNDTVKLVDYGGKIGVSWDEYVHKSGSTEKMIWCAVISLEKRSSKEIWGKVEWFDVVLTVPNSYKFVCAVAATV